MQTLLIVILIRLYAAFARIPKLIHVNTTATHFKIVKTDVEKAFYFFT